MSGRDTNHDLHLPRKSRQSFWKDPEPLRVERSPPGAPLPLCLGCLSSEVPAVTPLGSPMGNPP